MMKQRQELQTKHREAHIRVLFLMLLTLCSAGLLSRASAQTARAVQFGCDAPKGHVCHFLIIFGYGNSTKLMTIEAGQRTTIPQLMPNIDSYMVAIDRDPPSYPEQCGLRFPCKRVFVNGAYNN